MWGDIKPEARALNGPAVAALLFLLALISVRPAPVVGQTVVPCVGDCSDNGCIEVSELIRGVNIALERSELNDCRSFDHDDDGSVAINELISGVRAALEKCLLREEPAGQAVANVAGDAGESYGILRFGMIASAPPAVRAGALSPLPAFRRADVEAQLSGLGEPCDSGNIAVTCRVVGQTTQLTFEHDACTRVLTDTLSVVTDGTIEDTIEDTDAAICAGNMPLPGDVVTERLIGFLQRSTDASTGEVFESTSDLTTRFTFNGGGDCLERNGVATLNGSIRSRCTPGGGTSPNCPPEGTDLVASPRDLKLDVRNQLAGLEDRCIEFLIANGEMDTQDLIAQRRITAAYRDYAVIQDPEGPTGEGIVMNGEVVSNCLGKATFSTQEALVRDPAERCPSSGLLRVVLPDGFVDVTYVNGGVDLSFENFGTSSFPSCISSPRPTSGLLQQCPGNVETGLP